MGIAVQLVGALLILGAFVAVQVRRLAPSALTYVLANVAGSGILGVDAVIERQWGFVLLEVVWFAVSCWSLLRLLTGRGLAPPHATH